MNLLPTISSNRPRTACEIAPDGVVAARSGEPGRAISAAMRIALPAEAVLPSLKPGNLADRVAVIAAVRRSLEAVGARPNARGSDLTLVIPDGAARVLLLDFDALPAKLTEALPIVRFRLKKLLPFEADTAMISYQVMSSSRSLVRVLAVAIPRDVLAEYETAVREAGFEPGAVLPSTLAALPGLSASEPALLINGSPVGVTMAILQGETLLLHRTVDLQSGPTATPATFPPALFDGAPSELLTEPARPGAPAHGWNAYADRRSTEEAVQDYDGLTALPNAHVFGQPAAEPNAEDQENPVLLSSASLRSMMGSEADLANLADLALGAEPPARAGASPGERARPASPGGSQDREESFAEEIAQAVSVATAYFEDTLSMPPRQLWSAGSLPAEALARILHRQGLLGVDGLEVRELVSGSQLAGGTVSATVPPHTLAGVAGALRG